MKVRNWMTLDPITVSPDTTLMEARKIMDEKRIRRLPVVDKKQRMLGLVTMHRILEVMPSEATSLSRQERNYMLTSLTVGEIMKKNAFTVSPDDFVIDVIREGQKRGIGAFPVVEKGRLIGIATETEIFNATMHVLAGKPGNAHVVIVGLDVENHIGCMSEIARIVEKRGVPVEAIFGLPHRGSRANRLYIRARTEHVADLKADLRAAGYEVED